MTSERRRNKDISGYQILCILAEADGDFDPREGNVIAEYISEHFPFGGNLDLAMEEVSNTPLEDYPLLLQRCAENFYADSTEAERTHFLEFAIQVITADNKVEPQEDWMINTLYQYWDINTSFSE
jgi:uncharacterized tellurite resistance protein B-like protein